MTATHIANKMLTTQPEKRAKRPDDGAYRPWMPSMKMNFPTLIKVLSFDK